MVMNILSEVLSWKRPNLRRPMPSSAIALPERPCSHEVERTSTDRIQQILAKWTEDVTQCANMERTGQEFIEPYVLRTRILDFDIDLLIGTVTAKMWYDKVNLLTDVAYPAQLKMIKPGDVVFDLGAHNGVYSVCFSKLAGPQGRVYAFEPFPTNALLARFNSLLNDANVQVFEVGISNKRGELVMSAASERRVQKESEPTVAVSLDTLDRYAHLKPDFLKIDIEGAEIDALAGAKKVLARRPNICLEVHTHFFSEYNHRVEDLFDVLPMDDYICYIDHPNQPRGVYRREFPITEQCHLFLVKEDPVERIYQRESTAL
jgi:FkbM family methyltransferase